MHQILVPIDPSEYTKTAYKYALEIASHNNVDIEGIAIIDKLNLAEAASTFVPLPLGNEEHLKKENQLLNDAQQKAEKEIKYYEELCKTVGINFEGKTIIGRPDFIIEEAGKYVDLIITGIRNCFHFETSENTDKTVLKIIYHSNTPLLIVPKKFKPVKNVLIAFDGSSPAVKATREFAKLTWNKEYNITILTSNYDNNEGKDILQKIENYLNKHTKANITIKYTNKNIISVFDDEYKDKVDLVVCGIHSQNIIKKLFVGSFPNHLINLNKVPILLAQ